MDIESGSLACERALTLYLISHPHACDTADGIRRWWLEDNEEIAMEVLLRALAGLEAAGLIEATAAADGRRRYRRCGDDAGFAARLSALDAMR